MIIYPAIDMKAGKCVRLYKGEMHKDTIYSDSPAQQVLEWVQCGFSWLHLVDLDGAVAGAPANSRAVRDILASVDVPVQLGGGIRNMAQIEHWLNEGISRVILGTIAVRDPDLVKQACAAFPDQIVLGIDARNEMVAVEGWAQEGDINMIDLARMFEDAGAAAIIYTDIERDGTQTGVNIESTVKLAEATSIPVIASGGIGKPEHLQAVKDAAPRGITGVIVGKALYEKSIEPREALAIASS